MVGILGPILSTFFLLVGEFRGSPQGTYAVLPFQTMGIDRRLGVVVTNSLRGTFVKNHYPVLRSDIQQELLERRGYGSVECTQQACGIVLGQVLNVDFVVMGGILLRGEEAYLYSSLIEVRALVQ